jgi:hypothetical protein
MMTPAARKKPAKTEPAKPQPPRPDSTDNYPGAPTNPTARLAYIRRRNALIQGVDPDTYMDLIQDQDRRRATIAQRDPTGARNHT